LLLATGALLLAASAACGGDSGNGDDGGDDKEPMRPAATAVATKGDDGGDDSDGGSGALMLAAKNTLWDKTKLETKRGEVTIELDNQDGGIVHNIHVYKGKDDTGEDMGMTELEAGPVKQTFKFTAVAGEYFYVCDAHPATMAGTIEVGE
jgi:plastocyanin